MKTRKKESNKFSIGTDPEFMLKSGNSIVSAIPVIPNNKYNPVALDKHTRFYHDNVAIETTVKPSNSPAELVSVMRNVFKSIKLKLPNHSLCTVASHTFTDDECQHEDAKQFGCDPEFDVHIRDIVNPPDPLEVKNLRSSGGHIHLGNKTFNSTKPNGFLLSFEDKEQAVKLMDIFVGVPFVLLDNDPTSSARKKLYGKAGRFRPTDYGVEYRTLSPYWLTSPRLTNLIAELTFFVMRLGDSGNGEATLQKYNMEEVVTIINNNDKEAASKFIDKLNLPPNLLQEIKELSKTHFDQEIDKHW